MLPLAQSLALSFSVFAPDLPGHGRSQRPRTPLGIADLAAAVAWWLDAAGLRRPAFLANSMGCQILTELAVRLPWRVGPMVLIGPTVDPECRATRYQLLGGLRDAGREPRSLLALADRIEQRLPLIAQPTLVVRGEHDGVVGQRWAERALPCYPAVGSSSSRVNPTPSITRGPISLRGSSGSSSSRKASKQQASSLGASHIGTCPHRRRTSREPGRIRCHSAAIRAGKSRSCSPQTMSVLA